MVRAFAKVGDDYEKYLSISHTWGNQYAITTVYIAVQIEKDDYKKSTLYTGANAIPTHA